MPLLTSNIQRFNYSPPCSSITPVLVARYLGLAIGDGESSHLDSTLLKEYAGNGHETTRNLRLRARTSCRIVHKAMAAEPLQAAHIKGELHSRMLEQFPQPVLSSDHDGSSPEELPMEDGFPEEDAHSFVGFGISRAQTKLMSPATPAAEKAAAMADTEGGCSWEGPQGDGHTEDTAGGIHIQNDASAATTVRPSTPHQTRQHSTSLPSPWRAEPKTFEKQWRNREPKEHQEPMATLSDLNVRRYMANFNLPSLPKAPSFKDFSVPSLSSILSNTRSQSPSRRIDSRPKRSSTINQPAWHTPSVGSFQHRPTHDTHDTRSSPHVDHVQQESYKPEMDSSPDLKRDKESIKHEPNCTNEEHQSTTSGSASNASIRSPQPSQLRRTASDQSLLLRRVTSAGSSLGDDSRWENVQEQVNSRMKAIKDSLQDSNIKLPSLPNLSTLNLNSFRPDFTRTRAHSEAKRPAFDSAYTGQDALADSKSTLPTTELPRSANSASVLSNGKAFHAAHSLLDEALDNLTGDLVILGGYRGSVLRSAEYPHRQLWVPVKVGLNIRKVNLEVGLQPEDEENMHEHIFASGMLSHIGPIDMGRRLLNRLRTCKNTADGRLRIHEYGYDWRLSPHLLSRRFLAFLQELPCNAPDVPDNQKGATVIAHSMGGLITRHVVNRRPELFAGVVYAGVPQHCVNILGPLRNGDEVLLSSKVLTAQVNFTLRSSFLLLPENGKCFMNKDTKEEYPVNFFDMEEWKKYAWSPCMAPALPPANPPENKGILGSMTDMLPSMPSLPLPGRKPSPSRSNIDSNAVSFAADTASSKINNLVSSSPSQALDPQFSPTTLHTSPRTTIAPCDASTYLQRTLAATLAFKAEMIHDPTYTAENIYPPLSILYANNTPTVVAARVTSRDAIRRADAYDDLQFASGDGVCLARAAMLPEGYKCVDGGKVRTERGHVGLLGDLEAVGKCLKAVTEGRRRGIGLGLAIKGDRT